jgi:hypothetical protein
MIIFLSKAVLVRRNEHYLGESLCEKSSKAFYSVMQELKAEGKKKKSKNKKLREIQYN